MAAAVCVLRGRDACQWTKWTRWTKWTKMGRHGIPRGFACRSLVWLGRKVAAGVKPAKNSGGEARRASRRTHGQVCEGFLRDTSLKRSGNAPDRYLAFFAKLFFTWKKSGFCRRSRGKRFDYHFEYR